MFTKWFAGTALAVALVLSGSVWGYSRVTGDCCFPGSPCCVPGAGCCDECCYPGSPCCYPGSPCCVLGCCAAGSDFCSPNQACCTTAVK